MCAEIDSHTGAPCSNFVARGLLIYKQKSIFILDLFFYLKPVLRYKIKAFFKKLSTYVGLNHLLWYNFSMRNSIIMN